ncbi:hypothetical protein [Bacteroides acidifaciens]|uniref:hypothetical protein n=1 Tax=Bacteroides acidifaciens TaxID=85831 RepID=UPI003F694D59
MIRHNNYYKLLVSLGDLPIITTALPDVESDFGESSKRQPRNKVSRFILEHLQKATELLLDNSPGRKNRISKNVSPFTARTCSPLRKQLGKSTIRNGIRTWWKRMAEIRRRKRFNIDTEIVIFFDEP